MSDVQYTILTAGIQLRCTPNRPTAKLKKSLAKTSTCFGVEYCSRINLTVPTWFYSGRRIQAILRHVVSYFVFSRVYISPNLYFEGFLFAVRLPLFTEASISSPRELLRSYAARIAFDRTVLRLPFSNWYRAAALVPPGEVTMLRSSAGCLPDFIANATEPLSVSVTNS